MELLISRYKITESQLFMIAILIVNIGNYSYNLVLGRWLGPTIFADVAFIVTLLLMLSFIAMTIQLVSAKYIIELQEQQFIRFKNLVYKFSFYSGIFLSFITIIFANKLKQLFNLETSVIFYIFALGIPIYFILSVTRGLHQGKQEFVKLAKSYFSEMMVRVFLTFILIYLGFFNVTISVSIAILISFIVALFPNKFEFEFILNKVKINKVIRSKILKFLAITFLYECTQVIINNSDIILVKHFFSNTEAGLYASLALIGRVVFFITWMLIMILLPKVLELKKEGKNSKKLLYTYLKYICVLTISIVLACYLFPKTIIQLFFGNEFISMSNLLYKYAIATSLFALANLFVYYFLSLSKYKPVIIAMLFSVLQLIVIYVLHNTLEQVVEIQIILMFVLLMLMLSFFKFSKY